MLSTWISIVFHFVTYDYYNEALFVVSNSYSVTVIEVCIIYNIYYLIEDCSY